MRSSRGWPRSPARPPCGFEEIGLDLLVIVLVAAHALWLWRRAGARPLTVAFTAAYVTGLAVTLAVRAL
jgi:hypothetical protein